MVLQLSRCMKLSYCKKLFFDAWQNFRIYIRLWIKLQYFHHFRQIQPPRRHLQMNYYSRNNSYSMNKRDLEPSNIFPEGRFPSAPSKQHNVKSSNLQRLFRSSGSYIQKQKKQQHINCSQLNKSADVAFFLEKQTSTSNKNQQLPENINYTYIGQIQALQRRKLNRKSFYKHLKADKNAQQYCQINPKQQKTDDLKHLDKIVIKDLKEIFPVSQKDTRNQVQVEELHYKMVVTQQRFKNKWKH